MLFHLWHSGHSGKILGPSFKTLWFSYCAIIPIDGKLFESSSTIPSFQIKLVKDESPQFETILDIMFHLDEILIYFNFKKLLFYF